MIIWRDAVLTEKGDALLAKLTQGNTLEIVEAVTGAGFVDADLVTQTAVTTPKQNLRARSVSYPENGQCDLTLALTNEDLDTGYLCRQVGIFANDPDDGKILFIIAQSATATSGTSIPSETEMPGYCAEWTFRLQYGQADGVTVLVDPANTVSPREMEIYVSEFFESSLLPITDAQIAELAGTFDAGDGGDGSGGSSGGGTGGGGGTGSGSTDANVEGETLYL